MLLLIAFAGASLAWWRERTRQPEVYYLHIFSWHFRVSYDPSHPNPSRKWPEDNAPPPEVRVGPDLNPIPVCLATISFNPEIPLHIVLPNQYDPTIYIDGRLTPRGANRFSGNLAVQLHGPDIATEVRNTTSITLDELVHDPLDENFYVVSRSPDPYDLAIMREQPWNKTPYQPQVTPAKP